MGSLAKKSRKAVAGVVGDIAESVGLKQKDKDERRSPGVFTQRTPDAPSQTRDRRRRPMQMMGSIVEDPLGG